MYTCPVCGYKGLQSPPENFTICPSCYTEFGYDDATLSHEQLRREWIRNGMHWEAANITPPPYNWNPYQQLKEAGFLDLQPVSYSYSATPVLGYIELGSREIVVAEQPNRVTINGRWYGIGRLALNLPSVRLTHA